MLIKNLNTSIEDKKILKNIVLEAKAGSFHIILGKNGSGKSTLLHAIAKNPVYESTGEIIFKGENLLDKEPHEIAGLGCFLSFQAPIEIDGVLNNYFIKESINAKHKNLKEDEIDSLTVMKEFREKEKIMNFNPELLKRNMNAGFSGGEKKKNEIFQMLMLKPDLCLLDEIDSGLDIDATKEITKGIQYLRKTHNPTFIMVTHNMNIIKELEPDFVHVLERGQLVKTGGLEIVEDIINKGF